MLFGRVIDGKGGARAIDWADAQSWLPAVPGELMWLHLCRTQPGVYEWLQDALSIPEPTAEMLTMDSTRPRAFKEDDTLVATLRGINFNPGAEPEDMVSMQFWCDGQRLITLRRQPLQTPRDVLAMLDSGKGPVDAGALITMHVELMVARMNAAIVDMNDHIDAMEEMGIEENRNSILERTTIIRRNCLALKRHMGPQHAALETIARADLDWFEAHDRREIGETVERLKRYLDDIDVSMESALVLQDEIRARAVAGAERTNYLLTLVAAIFLPLGFLTGLLGINVGGMPGMNDPGAFWIVVGLCIAILAVQIFLFWRWHLFTRH